MGGVRSRRRFESTFEIIDRVCVTARSFAELIHFSVPTHIPYQREGGGEMLFLQAFFWALAVFGAFSAITTLCEWLFASQQVVIAVELRTREDAIVLENLLEEAEHTALRRGGTRTVVLISQSLMDGTIGIGTELYESATELIDRYDADCYLIE